MNRCLMILIACASLSACGGGPRTAEPARYDLGSPAVSDAQWGLPLVAIEVQAAPWLSATSMFYRFAYADPLRRQAYAESRWAAPPADLLGTFLWRRQAKSGWEGLGCRLQLMLDEFEQRFDDANSSQAVLEVRANLLPGRGSDILVRRAFRIQMSASSADARGGAAAAREAATSLADELAAWTNQLARDRPDAVARCRT